MDRARLDWVGGWSRWICAFRSFQNSLSMHCVRCLRSQIQLTGFPPRSLFPALGWWPTVVRIFPRSTSRGRGPEPLWESLGAPGPSTRSFLNRSGRLCLALVPLQVAETQPQGNSHIYLFIQDSLILFSYRVSSSTWKEDSFLPRNFQLVWVLGDRQALRGDS